MQPHPKYDYSPRINIERGALEMKGGIKIKERMIEKGELACDCDFCLICDEQSWHKNKIPISKYRRIRH